MSLYKRARRNATKQSNKISGLLAGRQDVINPYANVTDLSGMISNPYANMQVATQAAQMQAEQTDISLASALDTLRATGSGAGGATALAMQAASSKQQIAAGIEQQEIQNQKLMAQGEQNAMNMRMAEAQRMQEADIFGKTFMFQAQEQREVADLSRESALQQQWMQIQMDAKSAQQQMIGGIVQGLGSAAMAFSDKSLKKKVKLLGKSKSGLNIYEFEYKNSIHGEGVYQGVMADEVPEYARVKLFGYTAVDYNMIDVDFKRIR